MNNSSSELARAARLGQSGLGLHLIQNPAKSFSFVGSVPATLAYFRRDGQPISDQDMANIRQIGAGFYRKEIGTRTWETREAAAAAAAELGFEIAGEPVRHSTPAQECTFPA